MTTTAPNADEVADLRRRLDELESRVAGLIGLLGGRSQAVPQRWWRAQVGAFAGDPVYEEINRLGREWRQSQVLSDTEPWSEGAFRHSNADSAASRRATESPQRGEPARSHYRVT